MRTPPGIEPAVFTTALEGFRTAVGPEWVFTSDDDLDLYKDAYSPFWGEPEERLASAAVAPASVEQVQQVLRIANAYRIPIYPISTGRNLGYGGSAPVYSGSVVLDLKRMNRILDVNERNASCLVEPGVSYFDLYRHLREHKLKLWIDCPDPGWGSLIGNALDRGNGYTMAPYRDHFGAHCGMEVVLANGDLVRTGMGAMPGAQTWQQFKYGFGPYLDGIFSQSNYGVVTKMGFWLMPEPESFRSGTVQVYRYQDLYPLVDLLAELENSKVMMATTRVESPLLFGAFKGPPPGDDLTALRATPGGATVEALEAFATGNKVPYWSVILRFYGSAKVTAAHWEYAQERFAAIRGATFQEGDFYQFPLSDEQRESIMDKAPLGIPSLEAFAMGGRTPTNPTPSLGHIWFSPIIPMSAQSVQECDRVFRTAFKEWGVNPLGLPLPQLYNERTFFQIYGFPISHDAQVNAKNRDTFRRMIKLAAEHGWGEYRTATAFMDDCAETYSFNNHALRRLQETLKDAIDPNGILSAGRYGIWPRHLRKPRP
jgi:4-cresol dehydrogenase (hydroxylating)